MRFRVSLFIAASLAVGGSFLACFPDFQVAGSSGGSSGGPGDGALGQDGTLGPDGTSSGQDGSSSGADGNPGSDGSSSGDGSKPFDAGSSILIPQTGVGGFAYGNGAGAQSQVIITHDYYLDAKEAVVGRFRDWVNAGKPLPCTTGECTLDPGGPHQGDFRWDSAWNLRASGEAYKDPNCDRTDNSFTGVPTYNGTDDTVPINCVNWYQAAAFCWFDGQKRLPTQIEWQWAATGRGRGRTYPWGDTPKPLGTDCTLAIWRAGAGTTTNYNGCNFPIKGGSADAGFSFDGVWDMAGSVYEWTWDENWNTYPPQLPNDYSGPSIDGGVLNSQRISRGGGFTSDEPALETTAQNSYSAEATIADIGIRCAKSKP